VTEFNTSNVTPVVPVIPPSEGNGSQGNVTPAVVPSNLFNSTNYTVPTNCAASPNLTD